MSGVEVVVVWEFHGVHGRDEGVILKVGSYVLVVETRYWKGSETHEWLKYFNTTAIYNTTAI
jgi:hypothetical protein